MAPARKRGRAKHQTAGRGTAGPRGQRVHDAERQLPARERYPSVKTPPNEGDPGLHQGEPPARNGRGATALPPPRPHDGAGRARGRAPAAGAEAPLRCPPLRGGLGSRSPAAGEAAASGDAPAALAPPQPRRRPRLHRPRARRVRATHHRVLSW